MTKGCMLIISIIGSTSVFGSALRALVNSRSLFGHPCQWLAEDRAKLSHGTAAASERFLIAARLWDASPCLPLHPSHLPYVSLSTPSSYLPLSFFPSLPLFACFSITSPLSLFSSFPPHTIALTVPHKVNAPHQARILFPFLPPSPPACSSGVPGPPSSPLLHPRPPPSFPLLNLSPSESRVRSARLAARNPSLRFLISSFPMRHRSAHCAHPWAFRCRSLLSQIWLRFGCAEGAPCFFCSLLLRRACELRSERREARRSQSLSSLKPKPFSSFCPLVLIAPFTSAAASLCVLALPLLYRP